MIDNVLTEWSITFAFLKLYNYLSVFTIKSTEMLFFLTLENKFYIFISTQIWKIQNIQIEFKYKIQIECSYRKLNSQIIEMKLQAKLSS